jgi:hypothetical protein
MRVRFIQSNKIINNSHETIYKEFQQTKGSRTAQYL